MKTYRELYVWQKSVELVVEIYKVTATFPKSEIFGLTNQMRRASVSIPSNIAEGYCRQHKQEYIRFVRIAFASGGELETQLFLAEKLGFFAPKKYDEIAASLAIVMKMLNKFLQSLAARS